MASYPILTVEEFGRQLIESGDLDPVYIALSKVEWSDAQRKRWLVAYWLFYHPGSASYMCTGEGEYFWNRVANAARNEDNTSPLDGRWPRASERRHFRGDKCVKAVAELRKRFPKAEDMVDFIADAAPDYKAVFNRVCSLPQFGPWMAFKIADMLERVEGVPVDFNLDSVTMFDDPKRAAIMVWKIKAEMDPKDDRVKPKDPARAVRDVVDYLIDHFKDMTAPPAHDRAIGYQEVETVLCCWKSHTNGHYPVGNDIVEIGKGLREWAVESEAAREMLHYWPVIEQSAETIPA